MYGVMLAGFATALAFWEIWRLVRRDHQDQDHFAYAYGASENHSFGSHASNINTSSSSVRNSSFDDGKDPVYQSEPSRIYYYESYPNLSTSTSSTETSQLQPECGNKKSMEGTKPTPLHDDQSKPFLSQSSSLTSDQPLSSSAKTRLPIKESPSLSSLHNPPSLKPTLSQQQAEYGNNKSREGTKPTPLSDQSEPVLSQSLSVTINQPRSSTVKAKSPATECQSPSSFKEPSSSKLIFSPLASNSRNQPTKANSKQVVQKDTLPSCMIPKETEIMIEKDNVADVLKKFLSLDTDKDSFAALHDAEDFYDEYHARAKTSVTPISELNFLGLPIRPGAKDCPYYMCNGSCKYEANCKFNHPNPTVEDDPDSPSGYANGGSVFPKDASQAGVGSWSSSRTLNETSPFISRMISPNPLQNSEWNGYQDQDLHAIANQASERNSHRYLSFESHASNIYTTSSVPNCSDNDCKEPPSQWDQSQIYYNECYPNVSNSTNIGTISAKNSQLQAEYGNGKSMQRTEPQPSPDQSKPVLSQSSSVTYDKPRSTSAEAKPSTTKSQSPSSSKPSLSPLPSNSKNQPKKANSKWTAQKDASPICMIPEDIENLIKKGVVPDVLKKPLSQSTYKDYFAALLYAEDLYLEKWSNFQLLNVTLELQEASIYDKLPKNKNLKKSAEKDGKIFVALNIDSVPEGQPFLFPRDFVFAQHSGSKAKKFQGFVNRVMKRNLVLVEFEEEFYCQHDGSNKYDVSFSFNTVWLKRACQAISAVASGTLLEKYLFPEHAIPKNICSSSSGPCVYSNCKLDSDSNSAVCQILSFKGHPPYLVEGPLCAASDKQKLSKTGLVVREAVLQLYQRSSSTCRILICSARNSTGDILLRSLKSEILESVIFRANGAFGEVDERAGDILPSCVYEGKCSFPSLKQLKKFRVIFSTFVSSFHLVQRGIAVGHFSHIFLVDASSVTEPETMIPLGNFANENTTIVVTGAPNNPTNWVRSDIARKNGLRTSYFERLRATQMYKSSDPAFIMRL